MPKFRLEVQAQLQGVSSFSIPTEEADSYQWFISLLCGSCGEKTAKPVVVAREDEVEGIRGASVSLKISCKLCSRVSDLTIQNSVKSKYTSGDSPNWASFLDLEARGIEPVAITMNEDTPLSVKGTEGFEAEDAFIVDGEFYGFDEKLSCEMSITEFASRIVKV